ncbi:competence protein CoiA family protein [Streptomyces sp. 1-11]|uniref:competence protein CoiA family protein n=1 Tax=Streptomyces sp. 1-11 TaxID=2590549 RepID=UPI00116641F5|nr:competence protein CoiA family protein [Streptomyces sp. 1-11]GEK03887.1 hypothetical protein TNCT1_61630 [Streptomyces sp. 1-11]
MIHPMQGFEEEDTRKVQTAVAGRPGSDEPVFLPFDHAEFPDFLARYPDLEFFCGSLLGGCGQKLSAKRYTSKKCHFAHHPPVRCRRTANSESSADHLYVGRALKRWLQQQGKRDVSVSYDLFGADSGGCVDVSFDGGRRAVRVQLDRMERKSWLARHKELDRATRGGGDWIYGPDSMLAHNEVDAAGYALRVQCRTVGATREVQIGTQLPGHTIEWTTLDHCRLTDSAILTPHLEETGEGVRVRTAERGTPAAEASGPASPASPPRVAPAVFQLAPGTVAFTAAVAVAGADGSRRLYDADVQSTGSAVTPGRISLPAEAAVPDRDQIWLLLGPATLRLPVPGDDRTRDSRAVITAESIARLEGNALEPWQGLRPPRSPAPTAAPSSAGEAAAAGPAHGRAREQAPADPPPSGPPGPRVAGPPATGRSAAERGARAALQALRDQSREARDTGDRDAVRQTARYLAMLRDDPTVVEAVRDAAAAECDVLSAWSAAPTAPGHRLAGLLERLRQEGEKLPLAALRRLVEDAEAEADKLDRYLTTGELDELGRWSDELARRSGRPALDALERLGGEVRAALERYARAGAVVRWSVVGAEVDGGVLDLHPDDQMEVLVQADGATDRDEPLLSALVTDDDFRVHPFYARILDHLDRPVPAQADLRAQWERDVLRLHLLWSGPSHRAGVRFPGSP